MEKISNISAFELWKSAANAYNNKNYCLAASLFLEAAELGDSNSQFYLATMYYNGLGIDGAAFSSKDDLTVGQTVVVKGKLMKYVKNGTTTPEINGGVLVSK